MCDIKGKKRAFISISSDDDDEDDDNDSESESEYDDDVYYEDINASTSCDNDDEQESDDEDVSDSSAYDDKYSGEDDVADKEEAIRNKVIRLLREGSQLKELNLNECKTYLRKLKLRLSGTKAECISRIKEYWRVKDGNGEALYPRSSFNINCTGDVCKGDTVLFTQKVYQKFDKMKRSGNILGKRTVAGRITKESYGAIKQQHTFTVEVLWSKGIKKLAPLFPLLVKGRNLYKMRTYRQRWKNESERLVVLAEKHKRGAAAREVRGRKKMKTSSTVAGKKELRPGEGGNRLKPFNHQLSQTSRNIEVDKARAVHQHQYTQVKNVRANDHHKNSSTVRRRKSNQSTRSRKCESDRRHHDRPQYNEARIPFQSYTASSQDYYHTQSGFEHERAHLSYPSEWTHTRRFPHSRPYVDDHTLRLPNCMPYVDYHTSTAAENQRNNNVSYPHYAYRNYDPGARSFSRLPVSMDIFRPFHTLPYGTDMYGPRSRRGT